MARNLTDFWLYRYRYVIGYSIIGILLATLLVFAGLYVPGGLSSAEQASVVKTAGLDFSNPATLFVTNLPYHLAQAFILETFGINDFTIKLLSLVIGLASALGLIYLLRRWFPPSIAVLASLIAVTTSQFLLIAQSGTPAVLYIFWPILLLLLGTQITRRNKARFFWMIVFTIIAALSLYTPLSIYILIAIGITVALHPHLRIAVRRLQKSQLVICAVIALIILAPLLYGLFVNPTLWSELLGLPTTWPDMMQNLETLLTQYFFFWRPSATTTLTPVFGLGSALLIGLGLYRLIRTSETTRSYLTISWVICLLPVVLVNPSLITIVFLPSVLLLAAGLTSLIGYWYRLFPLNPYARVAGLIPIIVLVGVLLGSGVDRYVFSYHYSPDVANSYSRDLDLLPKGAQTLVVSTDEKPFYAAVAKYRPELTIVTTSPTAGAYVATHAAATEQPTTAKVSRIITNSFKEHSDRFYLYKP